MPDVVIENPIINSAFVEPARHFKFTDDGISNTRLVCPECNIRIQEERRYAG